MGDTGKNTENRAKTKKAGASGGRVFSVVGGGKREAAAAEQPKLFTPSYQSFQDGLFSKRSEAIPLKTTPETLPQDLGKTLAKSMVESGRTLTVE